MDAILNNTVIYIHLHFAQKGLIKKFRLIFVTNFFIKTDVNDKSNYFFYQMTEVAAINFLLVLKGHVF